MILQTESLQSNQPRISSNQLGEFIFATPKGKLRILHDQKFGNVFSAPYYDPAFRGIMRSFRDGAFSGDILTQQVDALSAVEAEKPYHVKKKENNVTPLENFIEIGEAANPPSGEHRTVTRNALVPLNGVMVSARPEIITENKSDGYAAFTKLRFSKSKASADTQEIVLLVLLHYGQQQSHDGLVFNLEKTKLIDCFSKTVVAGHTIGRHRDQQLHQALEEIRALWPTIEHRDQN
jgi:hypothetical protein